MVFSENEKLDQLAKLYGEATAVLHNLERAVASVVGMIYVSHYRNRIGFDEIHDNFELDGLTLKTRQILGLDISSEQELEAHHNNLAALARRVLVCESFEFCVDYLGRVARITATGKDPYAEGAYSIRLAEISNPKKGKAGSLIGSDERRFFATLVMPIRNYVRHNNSVIPPNKPIVYQGQIRGTAFHIREE